jgi:TrmH family RNA methyltransferase
MSPTLNKAHVSIILVRPQSPGNIGSVARVMRNMGFGRLVLVAPERFPHPEARMMASGARDLLEAAAVHDTLAAATATCHWLAGTSARQRQHRNMPLTPRLLGDKLPALCQPYRVGLVFGPEDAGLTTAELDACHDLVAIPTSPEAPSLNLAQAVAVVCYEISQPRHAPAAPPAPPLASVAESEAMYQHLRQALSVRGFPGEPAVERALSGLRRIFERTGLERRDVRLLRGIARQLGWALRYPRR